MYGSDNLDRYDASVCIEIEGGYSDYGVELEEVCDDLETLFITESAAAVSQMATIIIIEALHADMLYNTSICGLLNMLRHLLSWFHFRCSMLCMYVFTM